MLSSAGSKFSISSVISLFFQNESQKPVLFAVFSFLEEFFTSSAVVSVAKANVLQTRFLLETGQERIQILRHLDGAFDWLSVSSFVY